MVEYLRSSFSFSSQPLLSATCSPGLRMQGIQLGALNSDHVDRTTGGQ